MMFAMFFAAAGNLRATQIERLEGKYLKSRIKLRIDENWKVRTGNAAGAEATGFDDAGWATISVPHDMSITLVSTTNSDPGALGWYRKHFNVPAAWSGKRINLEFDGVFQVAEIFVNGQRIGEHKGGYTGFTFDITGAVKTGDNVVAVF